MCVWQASNRQRRGIGGQGIDGSGVAEGAGAGAGTGSSKQPSPLRASRPSSKPSSVQSSPPTGAVLALACCALVAIAVDPALMLRYALWWCVQRQTRPLTPAARS